MATDFSTLSVYSYRSAVATIFVSPDEAPSRATALLSRLFGPREHGMFSATRSPAGTFLICDTTTTDGLMGAAVPTDEAWRVLYIHEGSEERQGSEISGTLSALCARLADASVAVLNVCTLARNFMLVREAACERALATLRATVEAGQAGGARGGGVAAQPIAAAKIRLRRARLAICSFKLESLPSLSHALLHFFFLEPAATFVHYFEMGGEISIIFEQAMLDRLASSFPSSAEALRHAAAGSLKTDWRVMSVAVCDGYEGVGILNRVCLPLSSLPLMNVSTLDETFLLFADQHASRALKLLEPHFAVEVEE
ncbi:hypothetical protein AB1Y20_006854 [Prymnesium parvum]